MKPEPRPASVRDDLMRVCATGLDWRLPADRILADPVSARWAAVLMLFGGPSASTGSRPGADGDLDVLLLHRASTLREHPGQIGFPGGRVEPGDADAAHAAVREAVEETGLDPAGLDVLGALPDIPLPVSRHRVTPVLAWWLRPSPVSAVDRGETSEVFRVPVARLLDPENRRSVARVAGHAVGRTPAFVVDGRLVWGFTAIALSGLFDALGWARPWDASRLVEPTL